MDIATIILKSLDRAAGLPDEGQYLRDIHRDRSKRLVESIASTFREEFSGQPSVRVLSKHYSGNREEFGLNELLFDVLVCETGKVLSATGRTELTFVTKALWSVESELERNSRAALFDFNKLVLAACANKLFVGPQIHNEGAYLESLLCPAICCSGSVNVALVPHPEQWRKLDLSVHLWLLKGRKWHRQ